MGVKGGGRVAQGEGGRTVCDSSTRQSLQGSDLAANASDGRVEEISIQLHTSYTPATGKC